MNTFDGWNDELYHHGIRGQKWGLRRYQNPDGTLTAEGKARYGEGGTAVAKDRAKFLNKMDKRLAENLYKMDRAKNITDFNKHKAYVEKAKASAKFILDGAEKDGMRISQKKTLRSVNKGKKLATAMIGGALGSMGFGIYGIRNSNNWYTQYGKEPFTRVSLPGNNYFYTPLKAMPVMGAITGAVSGGISQTRFKTGTKYKAGRNV